MLLYMFIKSTYNLNISVPYIRADTGTAANTTILDLRANRDSLTHKEVYTCTYVRTHSPTSGPRVIAGNT